VAEAGGLLQVQETLRRYRRQDAALKLGTVALAMIISAAFVAPRFFSAAPARSCITLVDPAHAAASGRLTNVAVQRDQFCPSFVATR
jgi:hypothetical protein